MLVVGLRVWGCGRAGFVGVVVGSDGLLWSGGCGCSSCIAWWCSFRRGFSLCQLDGDDEGLLCMETFVPGSEVLERHMGIWPSPEYRLRFDLKPSTAQI